MEERAITQRAPCMAIQRARCAEKRDKEYDEGGIMIDRKWQTLSYFRSSDALFFAILQLLPQSSAQRQEDAVAQDQAI